MVKNLPCNVGEVGSIPHWGTKKDPTCLRATKPNAPQLGTPCAATTESTCSGAHAPRLEKPLNCSKDLVCHD